MSARPNVLMIVMDTARADAFSPYAAGRRTPAVQQLADRGVAHPHAIAPSCWTVPSHASMFLGAPPRSVGLSRAPNGQGPLCAPVIEAQKDRFLPEVMRRTGYKTAGVSANLWVSKRVGFATGFETFHDASGDRVAAMAKPGKRARLHWYLEAIRARADDGAATVERLLGEWLAQPQHDPFFWFVNLIECHSPYMPPKPWNDLGPLGRIAAAEDARRYQTLEAVMHAAATGKPPPEASLRRMRRLYDRSIELMDAWLARILEALDRARLLDDTIVIVTSDHGENFGEAGLLGHAASLDERLVHVPLVLAGPNVTVPGTVTSLADLPRIVADAAEVADHPWQQRDDEGIAVSQYDGPVRMDHVRAVALDDWGATDEGRRRLTERFTAVTDGRYKLVRGGEIEQLYDIASDQLEVAPAGVGACPPEVFARLRHTMDRVMGEGWDPQPPDAAVAKESADIEERMRLLGYL